MAKNDIFWTCDSNTIKDYFPQFLRDNYPNFKFSFNWENFPQIQDYLMRLMFNSFSNSPQVKSQLPRLIHDVELFFATGLSSKIFDKNNLTSILNNLKNSKNGFRIVEFLSPELSGLFGNSIENKIQINQRMTRHRNSPSLTTDEIRRLYMFHEMGHKILNILSQDKVIQNFINTIDPILRSKGLLNADLNYKEFIIDGFWMIEESITQELAEFLTYYSSKKRRPQFENRNDLGCNIETNHDYYGIFQMPTINLGKTIRGCSNANSTNEEVLLNMIKKALNSNFNLELLSEYNQGNAQLYYDLFLTLRVMGMIKKQKYASFGIGSSIPGLNVQSCLNAIANITKKNRDIREYPANGYPNIDFNSYLNPPSSSSRSFRQR